MRSSHPAGMMLQDVLDFQRHLPLPVPNSEALFPSKLPQITSSFGGTGFSVGNGLAVQAGGRWRRWGGCSPSSPCPAAVGRAPSPPHAFPPISTRAIKTSSSAAHARRNRLLVTDCYVFNEPEENKKCEGCGATQVCCSVCQIRANSDNSQMFGSSFIKEIYVRCRDRKFIPSVLERLRWQRGRRFPGPGGLLPYLRGCTAALPSSCQAVLMATDGQTTGKCAFRLLGGLIKALGSSFRSRGAL